MDHVVMNTFFDAAVALNLMAADDIWVRTVAEAMRTYRNMPQRIYWISNFLMHVKPNNAMDILRENLHFLVPPNRANDMEFLLLKLEMLFRRKGLTATEEKSAGVLLGLDHVDMDVDTRLDDRIQVFCFI